MKKNIAILLYFIVFLCNIQAQEAKTVHLITYGIAETEEEATKSALRSALEQTFGTFVSANTQIINDELIKDDIVSLSTGNIESYKKISITRSQDGKVEVTIDAIISVGRLVKYAQSKGISTELDGASFTYNMKMRKLNKENELAMLRHLYDKMIRISKLHLFDFNLNVHEPIVNSATNKYLVPLEIQIKPNDNYKNLIEEFKRTIGSLSLSKEEQDSYRNSGLKCYTIESRIDEAVEYYYRGHNRDFSTIFGMNVDFPIALRNPLYDEDDNSSAWTRSYIDSLRNNILQSSISFSILDNLGNSTIPVKVKLAVYSDYYYSNVGCNVPIYQEFESRKDYCENINLHGLTYSDNCTNKSFLPMDIAKYYNSKLVYKKSPRSYYAMGDFWSISDDELSIGDGRCWIFDGFNGSDIFRFSKDFLGLSDYEKNGAKYVLHFDLFYSEDELSKINKIELLPINPDSIKTITKTIENKNEKAAEFGF